MSCARSASTTPARKLPPAAWLRYLRQLLGVRVHFWPFDRWTPPPGRSVIAEVYPALWSRGFLVDDRNAHQHDAYSVSRWLKANDDAGTLAANFQPHLHPAEFAVARVEGWILGLG